MIRQDLKWELEDWQLWSNQPDGIQHREHPELDEQGKWCEKNLKKELQALNHYAHTKALSGVKELIALLINQEWTFVDEGEELKTVTDFSSIKKIYETWEFMRLCCENYCRYHVYQDESYLGCLVHDEKQQLMWGTRGRSGDDRPIFKCPYNHYMKSGAEEVQDQYKCKDFKARRKVRPFMEIVKEVDHT